jgi:UDPglucose 6-dehydrogenase
MAYNISVIGTGYVGLVTGTCFAATGNNVICVDIEKGKVDKLNMGIPTIFEPGLERYLKLNVKEERIRFTTDLSDAVKNSLFIFLCLPTPPNEDGSADLHHVMKVAEDIGKILKNETYKEKKIIINKSTVPVGTSKKVYDILAKYLSKDRFEVASNPEFLREGFAIEDSMIPERVVIGCSSKYVKELMTDLYQPFVRTGNPIIIMDEKSAEITKYAANSFLATKISFMNDLSAYCEKTGADIENIRRGIGSDSRIGKKFLFAGIGFGGSCFPKDVRALLHATDKAGTSLSIVRAAYEVNNQQITRFTTKIINRFGGDVKNKKFAFWGLAFKHNTDDTREAPAFRIINILLEMEASITAYDPEAMDNTKIKFGNSIDYAESMYSAAKDADALIIATEWNVFRNPDFIKLKDKLKNPLIFDGRNLYNPNEMADIGFEYYCVGRKTSHRNVNNP